MGKREWRLGGWAQWLARARRRLDRDDGKRAANDNEFPELDLPFAAPRPAAAAPRPDKAGLKPGRIMKTSLFSAL